MFRTTIRLYEERPADQEALCLLNQIRDSQHISYAEAIVTAVNSYYGDRQTNHFCFNEKQRAEIRDIIREELAATPVSIGGLLQAIGQQPMVQPQADNYGPDDADLDDIIDSLGS